MGKAFKGNLSSGEIASLCGVSPRTAIRWIEKGLIDSYRLPGGGDNRVRFDDFIKFLNQNNMPIPEGIMPLENKVGRV